MTFEGLAATIIDKCGLLLASSYWDPSHQVPSRLGSIELDQGGRPHRHDDMPLAHHESSSEQMSAGPNIVWQSSHRMCCCDDVCLPGRASLLGNGSTAIGAKILYSAGMMCVDLK